MAALSDGEKHAIVTLLAQFERPSDVVVHMRRDFGIEIDRFQVRTYDPTNARYEGGAKWRSIFEAARAAHLSAVEDIPIAHKAYRLNILQQILGVALTRGNITLVMSILRQAAREAGDVRPAQSEGTLQSGKPERPTDRTARIAEIAKTLAEQLQSRAADQIAGPSGVTV